MLFCGDYIRLVSGDLAACPVGHEEVMPVFSEKCRYTHISTAKGEGRLEALWNLCDSALQTVS